MGDALCVGGWAAAGFDANPTNIVTDVEGLGEHFQLLVASTMIEIGWQFLEGAGRTDGETIPARPASCGYRFIHHERKIGEDRDETNP